MTVSGLIFWGSLVLVCYTYLGYPALLWLLARLFPRPVHKSPPGDWPRVSVIIAARDEGMRLPGRLDNLLTQDYPADRLELICIADGCHDTSEEVLRQAEARLASAPATLRWAALSPGRGKPAALNLGMTLASGSIVVLADCRQSFSPSAIRELVASFSDQEVGAVSGELVFHAGDEPGLRAEMGLYWRYEVTVRRLESRSGSVVGATGAIYALRRSLYRPLPEETLLDDVLVPLEVVRQGFRVIFDGSAEAWDSPSRDLNQEWRRKVRTLAGNWQLFSLRPALFLPWRNPLWWRLLSHKICRLLVPWALLALLISGLFNENTIPRLTAFGLIGSLLAVGVIALHPPLRRWPPARFAYFFALLNLAAAWGAWLWLSGGCARAWQGETPKPSAPGS